MGAALPRLGPDAVTACSAISVPTVVARRVVGEHIVAVVCPFCGDVHTHGADGIGLRLSHCLGGGQAYQLVDGGELVTPSDLRRLSPRRDARRVARSKR